MVVQFLVWDYEKCVFVEVSCDEFIHKVDSLNAKRVSLNYFPCSLFQVQFRQAHSLLSDAILKIRF